MRKTLAWLITATAMGGCTHAVPSAVAEAPTSFEPALTPHFAVAATSLPKFVVSTIGTEVLGSTRSDLAVNSKGVVYFIYGRSIFRLGPQGTRFHFSGSEHFNSAADGTATTALFLAPKGLAFGADGTLYVADTDNIRKVDPKGSVKTLTGSLLDAENNAGMDNPDDVAVRPDGTLYVLEFDEIKKVYPDGRTETVLKTPNSFNSIAFDATHQALYASNRHQVFRVGAGGAVTAIAGKEAGALGDPYADGKGNAVVFGEISGITVDRDGNVFAADIMTDRIKVVTPTGDVMTVAGGGTYPLPDGPGLKAKFSGPRAITSDTKGNLYVTDTYGIRKLTRL